MAASHNINRPADGTRFVSEMYVPIRQDSESFEERQRSVWDDMHARMDCRRKEWDQEVSRLRKDFFRLRADDVSAGRRGSGRCDSPELSKMFCEGPDGRRLFRVSFDVSQFNPNEISVRTQEQRLLVQAKHEEKGQYKTVTREFNRQVDIPQNVDPQSLHSTLSSDGILQVEALVQTPIATSYRSPTPDSTLGLPYRLFGPSSSPSCSASNAVNGGSVTETDGSQVFRIVVDIGAEFEAGDLTVRTVDKKLIIRARHEEKTPGRTSCREFNREFDLPDAVDPQTVTAGMSSDGKLVIEAPLVSYSRGSYAGRVGSTKQPTITVSFTPASTSSYTN